ncbi:MAG TPA: UDP-N-acetylmuramoyl-L-alanyl-D-glutamate--2,6-diaminopimelate ligase [Fibrobacteria bacterium]|nr:UDP-N-acetylmuramoyl-L-alanyl-D-glutamate--2,6-diaminopimelate ligase [Fibrobacteria bacterium]
MKLSELLSRSGIMRIAGFTDPEVVSAVLDSRRLRAGDLFLAMRGSRQDGNDWADAALASGACAVLTDRPDQASLPGRVLVPSVADAIGPVCRLLAGCPDEGWPVLAVTGTNGKTSSAYLAEAVFKAAGLAPAMSSTVAMRHPLGEAVSNMTTPDPVDLWRFLAEARQAGARSLVLETSSHALSQGRIGGVLASAAVFTNLSRDHLDYHGSMEEYFEAKALLFTRHLRPDGIAVSNVDDPWGRILSDRLGARCRRISLGASDADWRIESLRCGLDGNSFVLVGPGGQRLALSSPLVGEVFARNLAGVAVACLELGIDPRAIREAALATTVPGRCQLVKVGGLRGAVDYAHTPDALERLLSGLRPLVPGRLVCVFGCGGDRDRGKRPQMGEIAARLADLAVATSDNPRTEDPESILDGIFSGVPAGAAVLREVDRRTALARAAADLREGDFLVVAGKGHEDYQIVGSEKRHFDDVEELERALARREGETCRN